MDRVVAAHLGLLVGAYLLLAACSVVTEDNTDLETTTLCLPVPEGWEPVTAELAVTAGQRQRGLQDRTELADDQGMLFLYQREQGVNNAFWMYRTRIALDIAWLDPQGTIGRQTTMTPCLWENPNHCERYPAGVPYRAALEVPAGRLQALGVETGDRLKVDDTPKDGQACSQRRSLETLFDHSF